MLCIPSQAQAAHAAASSRCESLLASIPKDQAEIRHVRDRLAQLMAEAKQRESDFLAMVLIDGLIALAMFFITYLCARCCFSQESDWKVKCKRLEEALPPLRQEIEVMRC